MNQEITRKDGIIYKRKLKDINYDCDFCFRFKKDNILKLKEIAKQQGTKYSTLARNILEEYIESYNLGKSKK